MPNFKDITGQRFGRLVAIESAGRNTWGNTLWRCQCDCHNTCIVSGVCLRRSNAPTRSCGCLVKESQGGPPKHGHARDGKRHPLYTSWSGMRDRCSNPNSPAYKNYGGRGIKVCERWNDFVSFLADVGERSHPGLVIDRIDNDGNYEPGNVRWTTYSESNRNKRPFKTRRDNRSGLKGVSQHRHRWQARIQYKGRQVHLGIFDTAQIAHAAYRYVAKRLHRQSSTTERIEAHP